MNTLGGVSKRSKAIYERFYRDREAQRFANLYQVFDTLAAYIDASHLGVKLEIDYLRLAEAIRSYFFDVIRYKEYHFDPKIEKAPVEIKEMMVNGDAFNIANMDPLSADWARLVHTTVNINSSKVAAYTVKWILKNKPVSVMSLKQSIGSISPDLSLDSEVSSNPIIANINEYYALHCALLSLGIDVARVSQKTIDELIYYFRFRNFEESAYFLILSEKYLCGCPDGDSAKGKET
jgi:hypothetical protein